jgi:hypothetical protein
MERFPEDPKPEANDIGTSPSRRKQRRGDTLDRGWKNRVKSGEHGGPRRDGHSRASPSYPTILALLVGEPTLAAMKSSRSRHLPPVSRDRDVKRWTMPLKDDDTGQLHV